MNLNHQIPIDRLFLDHAIATEAASTIPLTEIKFTSDNLDNHHDYDYTAPKAILVKRADIGVVTILDVVEQLGPYFRNLMEAILMVKAQLVQMTTIHQGGGGD